MSMNYTKAIASNEGSPEARAALSGLAHAFNVNPEALKVALNGAFDLLQIARGNPILALHLSFSRLNWRIDSRTLCQIISTFRNNFGALLSDQKSKCRVANNSSFR